MGFESLGIFDFLLFVQGDSLHYSPFTDRGSAADGHNERTEWRGDGGICGTIQKRGWGPQTNFDISQGNPHWRSSQGQYFSLSVILKRKEKGTNIIVFCNGMYCFKHVFFCIGDFNTRWHRPVQSVLSNARLWMAGKGAFILERNWKRMRKFSLIFCCLLIAVV